MTGTFSSRVLSVFTLPSVQNAAAEDRDNNAAFWEAYCVAVVAVDAVAGGVASKD